MRAAARAALRRTADDPRPLAQFLFEAGYTACWADIYVAGQQFKPLSDAMIERAWDITPAAYDPEDDLEAKIALINAAPDLLAALQFILSEDHAPWGGKRTEVIKQARDMAISAIAKATGAA